MYDVAIIGAGVVGASIGRELSRYALNVVLIEKEMDVSGGITKGNTAILHSGYNTKPGTLKAQLCQIGNPLTEKACKELEVPYKRVGLLLIAFDEVGVEKVYDNYQRGLENGVQGLEILKKQEVLAMELHLNDKAVGEVSLFAPNTGVICPWELTIALVENAVDNGVTLKLDRKVDRIDKIENSYIVTTPHEQITSRYIINCAGLFADEMHKMVSTPTFKIIPKRGEYLIS